MIDPGKYTVIKTADLQAIIMDLIHNGRDRERFQASIASKRKDGATAILPEDLFAAPALYAYSASISVAMNLLPPNHPDREHLRELSDYFQSQAEEANEKAYKVPDDD